MALSKTDLVLWAHGNDKKVYTYTSTADSLATIEADAYFDDVAGYFTTGDLLYAGASDGVRWYEVTATATDIALSHFDSKNDVDTASSSANIKNYGVSQLNDSSAAAFTLDAPFAGVEKSLIQTTTSTHGQTVTTNSTGVTLDVAGSRTLTFNGADDSVILKGLTATRWGIVSNIGSVATS